MSRDRIDTILNQWHQEAPQWDMSALSVVGRVMRIARLLEKHREAVLAEYDLSVWSFDVLATLRRQGFPYRLKPTELYSLLMLSSGAMTNRIDRLEKAGVVTRLRDPNDRRSISVQLTETGIQRLNAVIPVLFEQEKKLFARFSDTQTETFIALLREFLIMLDQDLD